MKDELRVMALCGVILLVMYVVGEGIIDMAKAFCHAWGVN